MTKEQKEKYKEDAENHADFLYEKVFKPAFIMAFIHGAKHGREDAKCELDGHYQETRERCGDFIIQMNTLKNKEEEVPF